MDADSASGLGGRLLTRAVNLGGGGKLAMLVVLRTVFPGVGRAEVGDASGVATPLEATEVLRVGTAGVDCVFAGRGVGNPEVVTARVRGFMPDGITGTDPEPVELGLDSDASGVSGNGFLVFASGNAGRGPDGGGDVGGGGREVGLCGMAEVVMVAVIDVDIAI